MDVAGCTSLKSWRATVRAATLASACAAVPPCSAQEARSKELPVVWVLATGGTISGRGASSTSLTEY
jgi:L-asparaginase/Glu-tRNA(Gln) amidotransferase subunit D